MLSTIYKDTNGHCQYMEHTKGLHNIRLLKHTDVWAIRNPSSKLIIENEGFIRKYMGTSFMMSEMAYKTIPPYLHGAGSTVILILNHQHSRYYILVSDEQFYIRNCMEHNEKSELPEMCARRILKEELSIRIPYTTLIEPITNWTYSQHYPVVDANWSCRVSCFKTTVSFDMIQHLTPSHFNITDDYIIHEYNLKRTRNVIFIKVDRLENAEKSLSENFKCCPQHFNLLKSID